jgi:hypothetical protein
MTDVARAGSLPDGEGAAIELETSEGPLEIRFTYEDAERLIAALQSAQQKTQAKRARSAKPPLPESAKPVARWETAIDPVNQDAVIRARYSDQTTQETRIPRSDLPGIARFLDQACRRFEGSADMRQ